MAPKPRDFFPTNLISLKGLFWQVWTNIRAIKYKLLLCELMGSCSAAVWASQFCRAGEIQTLLLDKVEKGRIPRMYETFGYCSSRKVCSDLSSGKMDSALRSS